MSKSNAFGPGAMALLNVTEVQVTLSCEYPRRWATWYATADSKPLPFLGSLSENHGSYAGLSVPIVSLPAVLVLRAPAGQTLPEAEADAAGDELSSAGAHAARAASSSAAPPTEVRVFRLTMTGSLGHVSPAGAVRRHPVTSWQNAPREDVRRAVRRASGESGGQTRGFVHRRRPGARSPLHREEGRRRGGRVLDGR